MSDFSADEMLCANPSDQEARAYEAAIGELMGAVVGRVFEIPRVRTAVEVRGQYPSAQIVSSVRDLHTGDEGEAESEIWDERSMICGRWDASSDVVSSVASSRPLPPTTRITRRAQSRPA